MSGGNFNVNVLASPPTLYDSPHFTNAQVDNLFVTYKDIVALNAVVLNGSVSGQLSIKASNVTTSYSITMPDAQGNPNTFLKNDGIGNLSWSSASGGSGDVSGPSSAIGNSIPRFNGGSGKLIKTSSILVDDSGNMSGTSSITLSSSVSGTLSLQPAPVTLSHTYTLPSNQGTLGAILTNDGSGNLSWTSTNVNGPTLATSNSIARFDGSTGKIIKNSSITISDSGNMNNISTLGLVGLVSGNTLTIQPSNTTNTQTYILPGSQGAAGTYLQNDGSGILSWGVTPQVAGTNTNVQFNDSNTFGGVSSFTYNKVSNELSVGKVTGLSNPSNNSDAANKQYVDLIGAGLKYKNPVNAATTTNIASLSGLLTVDTVILTAGQRVLVKNQTVGTQNGIYDVSAGSWSRSSDLPTSSDASGVIVFVLSGSTNINYSFICNNVSGSAIVGTNSLSFITYTTSENGNVIGPVGSNNNSIVRFDSTSGKIIKNSTVSLSDAGDIGQIQTLNLKGSTSGILTLSAAASTTSHTYIFPSSQGTSNTYLKNDGTGVLSWGSGVGDVIGPILSSNNCLTRFNGASGKIIKSSTVQLDDSGNFTQINSISLGTSLNFISISPSPTSSNYNIILPAFQGGPNTALINNGTGQLTWDIFGNINGPVTSTINAIPRFSNSFGDAVKDSTVLLSDSGDLSDVKSIALKGTSNSITIQPSLLTSSYTITLPANQGLANTSLVNDGSGQLAWVTLGNVTGPVTSTTNAIPRYSNAVGDSIKNSVVELTDAGDMSNVRSISLKGLTNSVTISPTTGTSAYNLILPSSQATQNTVLKNDGTGTLSWSPVGSCFALRHNTSQSVPNNVDTTMLFNTVDTEFDTGDTGITYLNGTFTNSNTFRVTVTISYQITFATNSTGYRFAFVQLLGIPSTRVGYITQNAVNGNITTCTASCTITLAASSQFKIVTFQTSGAALLSTAGGGIVAGYANRIQITRIA